MNDIVIGDLISYLIYIESCQDINGLCRHSLKTIEIIRICKYSVMIPNYLRCLTNLFNFEM